MNPDYLRLVGILFGSYLLFCGLVKLNYWLKGYGWKGWYSYRNWLFSPFGGLMKPSTSRRYDRIIMFLHMIGDLALGGITLANMYWWNKLWL